MAEALVTEQPQATRDRVKIRSKRKEAMKNGRSQWDAQWQSLKDLVRPASPDFYNSQQRGEAVQNLIYDGTAGWAAEQLASGLQAFLTSPTDRWFNVTVKNTPVQFISHDVQLWLELVSDTIYSHYADSRVNFDPMMHELDLDIIVFGTGNLFQEWNSKDKHIVFRSHAVANCFIAENENNIVDTLIREIEWSGRQIERRFGGLDNLPPKLRAMLKKDNDPEKAYNFLHSVWPRKDRTPGLEVATNMPWASVWDCEETAEEVSVSGFNMFPYHCPRWMKIAGETYGRSPGMTCLPDIRMVNEMMKNLIQTSQLRIAPPIMMPSDGFSMPIQWKPYGINYYEPGSQDRIEPLNVGGDAVFGIEFLTYIREQITRCFYVDWLLLQKNNVEMTATEVLDRREEKLRLMAPMLGRLQSELLGPMLKRTYTLLNSKGLIPDAPEEMAGSSLDIQYVSPAAKAQFGTRAIAADRWIQSLTPLAQAYGPQVLDALNPDRSAQESATWHDVPRRVLNSNEEIEEVRAQRQTAADEETALEQAKVESQVGVDTSTATRNIAAAQESLTV